MKILQVIPYFHPALAYGGPVPAAYHLSKELVKRGHEVTVYATDTIDRFSRQKEKVLEIEGIQVHYFRNLSNSLGWNHKLFLSVGMIPQSAREIKNSDIIHFHEYRTFQNIVVHHYARKHGVPYVLEAWGSVLPFVRKQGLKRLFDRLFGYRILKDAARAIAGAKVEIDEYRRMGVEEGKITLISPTYDIDSFSHLPHFGEFREKYGLKEKHIILFLGRIDKIKGIDFLVESFHELVQERDDVALVIVGPDAGYKPTVESLINKLNLSTKVLFTGFLGGADKLSALVDATMLVQTSVYERGPGSPFEAILCNTPIIVTKDTGCGEIVAQLDAGYLVKYGNVNELKTTMEKVLDDPTEARDKMRKAKQHIVAYLSYEKVAEEYERLYESVIAQRRLS